MAVKKGLGRGLNTLIPTDDESASEPKPKKAVVKEVVKEVIKEVPKTLKISEIEPNREQPRKQFDEDALVELSESIKQFGIIQPILVTKRKDYYEIVAGERRWRAARLAGLKEVPVIIKDFTEQEIVEIALIENIQRENLNPIEEALTFKRLIEEFKLKQDDLAERVSKSRTAITNSMRLLKLSNEVQEMVIEDKISSGHARAILGIDDTSLQYELACKIFDEKLSVRETEKLVSKLKANPDVLSSSSKQKNELPYEFLFKDTEEKLKNCLGSKVHIKPKNENKGKIEIEYFSKEELDRISDLLYSVKHTTSL